jgi:hypothetical protein
MFAGGAKARPLLNGRIDRRKSFRNGDRREGLQGLTGVQCRHSASRLVPAWRADNESFGNSLTLVIARLPAVRDPDRKPTINLRPRLADRFFPKFNTLRPSVLWAAARSGLLTMQSAVRRTIWCSCFTVNSHLLESTLAANHQNNGVLLRIGEN